MLGLWLGKYLGRWLGNISETIKYYCKIYSSLFSAFQVFVFSRTSINLIAAEYIKFKTKTEDSKNNNVLTYNKNISSCAVDNYTAELLLENYNLYPCKTKDKNGCSIVDICASKSSVAEIYCMVTCYDANPTLIKVKTNE